jgi:hypothetical protein
VDADQDRSPERQSLTRLTRRTNSFRRSQI